MIIRARKLPENLGELSSAMRMVVWLGISLLIAPALWAQTLRPMGPPGGDVRSLAADPADPRRIYLGASDGHLFISRNTGQTWQILGRVGSRQDAVVAAIIVDLRSSNTLYAGTWTQDPRAGGGVFRSKDGGHTWEAAGLAGQPIRALAQSASNPDVLVAGTLDGVYGSRDAGRNWQRISPLGHKEIRNLDSVAVDPRNPNIIYVGTFHLPWKTGDGGRTWLAIHEGMIDDSDVFSMVIDRTNPQRIYASACSGIYRSDNGGRLWRKIQGIPFSARRTHVIAQDPQHPGTLYAGTTEGLWITDDASASWRRVTPRHWVVNALVVSRNHPARLVMGTERLGVLVSDEGGETFREANEGFLHRQIIALALDRDWPERILAVLANSPEPVLATEDGGRTWLPLGTGLTAEGVLRVYLSPNGWWAALERGGLMRFDPARSTWVRAGTLVGETATTLRLPKGDPALRPVPSTSLRASAAGRRRRAKGPVLFGQVVQDLAFSRDAWFAATPDGLFASRDRGATWSLFPFAPLNLPVRSVRVSPDGEKLWLVSLRGMVFTRDGGKSWSWHDLPLEAGGALRLDVADNSTLLAAAHNGLYISRDAGVTWLQAAFGLPAAPAKDVAIVGNVFLVSMQTGGLYISYDRGHTWTHIEGTFAEGYFPVVTAGVSAELIFAASATDGIYAITVAKNARNAAGSSGTP